MLWPQTCVKAEPALHTPGTAGFQDVAALWLQRARDKEADDLCIDVFVTGRCSLDQAVKPLIGIVPQLLKTMAFRLDDASERHVVPRVS